MKLIAKIQAAAVAVLEMECDIMTHTDVGCDVPSVLAGRYDAARARLQRLQWQAARRGINIDLTV